MRPTVEEQSLSSGFGGNPEGGEAISAGGLTLQCNSKQKDVQGRGCRRAVQRETARGFGEKKR